MSLTPEQLQIIRDATIDESAFNRVISVFEETKPIPSTDVIVSEPFMFNLDSLQVRLLSDVLSIIPSVIFIKDLDSRIIMVNQACLEMNHCTRKDELIGKTDFDIMTASAAQIHYDREQELLRTGIPIINRERHYIDIDQSLKWYLESKSPIYDQDRNIVGLIGIIRDITSQKLAEKTLENERNLLQTLIDHVQDKIYIKDRQSCFIGANAETLKAHKVSKEQLLGSTDFDYMSQENAQQFFLEEQRMMATGVPIINQELNASAEITQGDPKWYLVTKVPTYDEHGDVSGLVGVNHDITHQKLAEQQLENKSNLLQTLIDHIQDKIYIKDRQSRFIVANAETLKAQYVSSEELMGTTDASYMPAERAQKMFEEEQRIMATGKPIINQELYVPPDVARGDEKWYLITKVPTYDEHGDVSGLVGVNHDITEIKLAERKATDLKLEQERIKILSDFITNSSHEFRTPISVINTSAYLLKKVDDREKQQKYIDRITQQTTRLMNLLDSLLLMSRLDRITSIEKESINLQSFLQNIIDQFQTKLLEKHQSMQLFMDNPELTVPADESLLATAVSRIVDNAILYTPDHQQISLKSYSQDNQIIIDIQDKGVGMTDEIQNRVFERFYREDEAHSTSGFGLGLSIALRIINLHDGRIELESEVNVGSTFKIR